jgi:RNA polymerase-binding transcription factor DksA
MALSPATNKENTMIDKATCEEFHKELFHERTRLEQEIMNLATVGVRGDQFLTDETDAVDQHPGDDASELFEREKNVTLQRTLEASLMAVNDALRKFDEGTYGSCEDCGKVIAEKRLRALPSATHCIECQSKLEKRMHAYSR